MSWIMHPEGDGGGRHVRQRPTKLSNASTAADATPAPATPSQGVSSPGSVPGSPFNESPLEDDSRAPDPVQAEVSTKQANRPFLAYAQYREEQKRKHQAWLKRKKERQEKIARGEEVGPEEPDPTEEPEVGCMGLLKFIVISLVVIILAGKFFTGSFLWEQDLPDLSRLIPKNQRLFSERMLSTFTGDVESKPIYLAVDGDVYDVSSNRRVYGPGGSYHFMAGRDAARAFATGCFATHLTHDIRGLSEREMQGLEHWKKFFSESKKYRKVGRVLHEPIDPMSPIPEPCDPKKAAAQIDNPPAKEGESKHDEL